MAVSATKMNSNWLASSINCCFPTRLPDRPHYEREFERDMDKQVEAQGYSTARREPAMPMSKYNLTSTVTSQPQQTAPPSVPTYSTHIVQEHPRYSRESSRIPHNRISKQDETTWTWYGEEPEAVARRMSKRSRKSTDQKRSVEQKRSMSRKRSSRRQAQQERSICISPIPQIPAFRPLHLSIHLPGNELPTLPQFSDDPTNTKDAIPPVPQIPRPAQAVLKARPLVRDTSCKTVAAIPFHKTSSDTLRRSTDTDLTMCEPTPITRPRTSSLNYSRLRSPSAASARSNQDFLEMLNNPLPALPIQYHASPTIITAPSASTPPPPALLHPSKKKSNRDLRKEAAATSPEIPTLVRSASDQNKRLQAHLLEREEVNVTSPACSTIAEEKTPTLTISTSRASRRRSTSCPAVTPRRNVSVKGLGIDTQVPSMPATKEEEDRDAVPPMSATITDFRSLDPLAFPSPLVFPSPTAAANTTSEKSENAQSPTSPESPTAFPIMGAVKRSSTGSSTLLNPHSLRETPDLFDRPKTEVVTTITAVQPKPISIHVSARLSQWLSRSRGMSMSEKRESMLSLLRSEVSVRDSIASGLKGEEVGGESWFDGARDGESVRLSGSVDERAMFSIEEVAKEIGLGELLDQRLGIRHSVVVAAEGRPRSGTDSTFVGTEKGSLDLMRKYTGGDGSLPVGVAM